ncbi:hypothetical protein BH11MYX1_BH11MYX1_32920 [soil metagenome]
MKQALVIALALSGLCGRARADTEQRGIHPDIVDTLPEQTRWQLAVFYDQDWFGSRGIEPDGKHVGLAWTRDRKVEGAVLVLRREVDFGEHPDQGRPVRVAPSGSVLGPQFLGEPHEAVAPIDAATTPLVAGDRIGRWTVITSSDGDHPDLYVDEVTPGTGYIYIFIPAVRGAKPDTYNLFPGEAIETWTIQAHPALFNRHRWFHLALILIIAGALGFYTWLARRKTLFVRRLAGVDAIEDAVGRSTEMGRPVLYVTGVEETQDIQTLASLLILGHVAKITAEYETELRVANAFPLTMVIAEEVVRQGYANAGRADAHRPENVMFVTSDQFAFAAGVNGMILRERPATNIYFGRFYAESLLLAETGFLTGAIQIAGTGELTQLPFFISACDFTLMGEELFACSAYLTREPNQLALLKAGDVMKVVIALLVVGFTVCATMASQGWYPFTRLSIEDVVP